MFRRRRFHGISRSGTYLMDLRKLGIFSLSFSNIFNDRAFQRFWSVARREGLFYCLSTFWFQAIFRGIRQWKTKTKVTFSHRLEVVDNCWSSKAKEESECPWSAKTFFIQKVHAFDCRKIAICLGADMKYKAFASYFISFRKRNHHSVNIFSVHEAKTKLSPESSAIKT